MKPEEVYKCIHVDHDRNPPERYDVELITAFLPIQCQNEVSKSIMRKLEKNTDVVSFAKLKVSRELFVMIYGDILKEWMPLALEIKSGMRWDIPMSGLLKKMDAFTKMFDVPNYIPDKPEGKDENKKEG